MAQRTRRRSSSNHVTGGGAPSGTRVTLWLLELSSAPLLRFTRLQLRRYSPAGREEGLILSATVSTGLMSAVSCSGVERTATEGLGGAMLASIEQAVWQRCKIRNTHKT